MEEDFAVKYDIAVISRSNTEFLFKPWTNKGSDWLIRMLDGHLERMTAAGAYIIEDRRLAEEIICVALSDQISVGPTK